MNGKGDFELEKSGRKSATSTKCRWIVIGVVLAAIVIAIGLVLAFAVDWGEEKVTCPPIIEPTEEVPGPTCSKPKKPPHIVLVLTDDMGMNDIGWNSDFIQTPKIDNLARRGVILNNTYVMQRCTPSRIALLTGLYPMRTGFQNVVIDPMEPIYLSPNFTLLSEKLKENGYSNHLVGKWHLGACEWDYTPFWRGFDSFYGFLSPFVDYYEQTFTATYTHDENEVSTTGLDFFDNTGHVTYTNGTYLPFLLNERANKVIENHNPNIPLFLYMATPLPHSPLQVPDEYRDLYPQLPNQTQSYSQRRIKAGMVSVIDDIVGNLTTALQQKDMWKDTIFIFISDNGGPSRGGSNYPLRGWKNTPFEGGIRVPAFIYSELLHKTGYVNNEMIHVVDLFPTLLYLAGVESDSQIDGVNQWDTLCNGEPTKRTEFFIHTHPTDGASIRSGDYKYMEGIRPLLGNERNRKDGWAAPPEDENAPVPDVELGPLNINTTYLFNVKDDPLETTNLAEEPEYKAIVLELQQKIDTFLDEIPPMIEGEGDEDPAADPMNYGGFWTPGWC